MRLVTLVSMSVADWYDAETTLKKSEIHKFSLRVMMQTFLKLLMSHVLFMLLLKVICGMPPLESNNVSHE